MPSVHVPRLITFFVVAATIAGTSTIAPLLAGEDALGLPPAEYKGLPKGTKVTYSNHDFSFKVTRSEGFELTYRTGSAWPSFYALFGKTGYNQYAAAHNKHLAQYDDKVRSVLEQLWPLEVGNERSIQFKETHAHSSKVWTWRVTFTVLRAEYLTLNGKTYATYIVGERGQGSPNWTDDTDTFTYTETLWYHPPSGLILKRVREVTSDPEEWLVRSVEYSLLNVNFPEGVTTHTLTPVEAVPAVVTATPAMAPAPTATVSRAVADSAMWNEIEYSTDIPDYQRYLEKFPNGVFVSLAEQRMRNLVSLAARAEGTAGAKDDPIAGIAFGSYHALVIGINDYENLPKLKTAVNDAKGVSRVLTDDYGFKVTLLLEASRGDIVEALDKYRETLGPQDNLLIYYAGHGWLDEDSDRGYWLPANAKPNRRTNWVSNATITDTLKSLAAKHVMVVADSCFSGTLTRAAAVGFRDKSYLRRMASKQARVALVSGGLEPVSDKGGGGNSPFARAFLDALRSNKNVIDGTRLFIQIRRPVILNTQQTPQYSDVRNAGHEGGDFLFVRKK